MAKRTAEDFIRNANSMTLEQIAGQIDALVESYPDAAEDGATRELGLLVKACEAIAAVKFGPFALERLADAA